jgi:hypothetical protein
MNSNYTFKGGRFYVNDIERLDDDTDDEGNEEDMMKMSDGGNSKRKRNNNQSTAMNHADTANGSTIMTEILASSNKKQRLGNNGHVHSISDERDGALDSNGLFSKSLFPTSKQYSTYVDQTFDELEQRRFVSSSRQLLPFSHFCLPHSSMTDIHDNIQIDDSLKNRAMFAMQLAAQTKAHCLTKDWSIFTQNLSKRVTQEAMHDVAQNSLPTKQQALKSRISSIVGSYHNYVSSSSTEATGSTSASPPIASTATTTRSTTTTTTTSGDIMAPPNTVDESKRKCNRN